MDLMIVSLLVISFLSFLISTIISSKMVNTYSLKMTAREGFWTAGAAFGLLYIIASAVRLIWSGIQ